MFAPMSSPADRLVAAIEAWLADDARERLARARGAADADPAIVVAQRHSALRGPRARELWEESRERGLLDADAERAIAAWLRDAFASVGRARAADRARAILGRRVPHDSDHHPPMALLERMITEAHAGRRRAIARSLTDALAPSLLAALREGLADVEESLEAAAWLREVPVPADERSAIADEARAIAKATDDAWAELVDRAAHAAGAIDTWPDLLAALRAARFDALFDRRQRWRRAAESLSALGVADALGKRARVEHGAASFRARSTLVPIAAPRDVRIVAPGIELGLASERDALSAIGRAAAAAWTHPALPSLVARREHGSVAALLGGLFAHLLTRPTGELGATDARAVRERSVMIELFELRTDAAFVIAREHVGASSFAEAAEHALREAWRVEVPGVIAACACLLDPIAPRRARAGRWVAPLFCALRERYDEDWWRNPRAAEPLRAAAERGPALAVEPLAEELGLDAGALPARYAELLR